MSDWLDYLAALNDEPGVLVSVAETRGSTPRETGTKMLITRQHCYGTIGGGNLEFQAIAIARELLVHELLADTGAGKTRLRRFPLGPSLGQCCGGVAILMFEPLTTIPEWVGYLRELRRRSQPLVIVTCNEATAATAKLIVGKSACFGSLGDRRLENEAVKLARQQLTDETSGGGIEVSDTRQGCQLLLETIRPDDFHIVLFGAGHVGKALVSVLSGLPCSIDWIDSRAGQFPDDVPANVRRIVSEDPEYAADDAPSGSYFLIMTHSHPLDQAICARILQRGDFRYCGLIGSDTKRARFEHRLHAAGFTKQQLQTLTCPIGVDGISGKHPLEIAIAVAAELLQVHERHAAAVSGIQTAAVA